MNRRSLVFAPLLASALATTGARFAMAQAPTPAPALVVSGVNYAPSAQVGGSTLLLNGAGTRYKFVIKVYTAGLYLTAKTGTPDGVANAPGPKRLHVVMLREIDANELGKLFTRGMQDNAPRESFSRSIPGTLRMSEIFSSRRKLVAGDNFSVDWVPGVGTTVLVNGQPQGAPIKEPEFFTSLMSIWLGPRPADDQLKDALLGLETGSASRRGRQ